MVVTRQYTGLEFCCFFLHIDFSDSVSSSSGLGIHLPTPITVESIQDLIDTFKQDEPTILHRKYCSLILRQVGEILKKDAVELRSELRQVGEAPIA